MLGSQDSLLPAQDGGVELVEPVLPSPAILPDTATGSGNQIPPLPDPPCGCENHNPTSQNLEVGAPSTTTLLPEWKSWKIKYPWLTLLLILTISIFTTIATLNAVSKENNGFAALHDAPGFLARDPDVEKAIWSQGILYTAFPAFIMTLYRTMWESTIAAFADRQPYIDIKKEKGRPAKATIMLDYKTEPALWSFKLAFQNKHYFLSMCMVSSVLLTLIVVPVVAFLFTTSTFALQNTIPVSSTTTFLPNSIFPDPPDLRLSLTTAASILLQNASRPQWTDGIYAFPKHVLVGDVRTGNTTLQTTAYSTQPSCRNIPITEYNKTIVTPLSPCTTQDTRIDVAVNDRGCEISSTICIRTTPGTPWITSGPNYITTKWTSTCSPTAGWSRTTIVTAKYINSSTGITDFNFMSCSHSYLMTPGTLTIAAVSDLSAERFLQTFIPQGVNSTSFRPGVLWGFIEKEIIDYGCFDKLNSVISDEFGRYVYAIAAKRSPSSPLLPEAIIDGFQALFSTTFAVLVGTEILKPSSTPVNTSGIHTEEVSRLIVVSPVAYIILSILMVVALLNICLFFYANQESILVEEPVGLVSAASVLHKSVVSEIVAELMSKQNFNGKITEAMDRNDRFMTDRYKFDEHEKRIIRYKGVGTPRRSWWKEMLEWLRGLK